MVLPVNRSDLKLRNAIYKAQTPPYVYVRPQPQLVVDKRVQEEFEQKYIDLPQRDRYNRPPKIGSSYLDITRCFTHKNQNTNDDRAVVVFYGAWLHGLLEYLKSVNLHSPFLTTYDDFHGKNTGSKADIVDESGYRLYYDPYFPKDIFAKDIKRIHGYFVLDNLCMCMLFDEAFKVSWKYYGGATNTLLGDLFAPPVFVQRGIHVIEMAIRELQKVSEVMRTFDAKKEPPNSFWDLSLTGKKGPKTIAIATCVDQFQKCIVQVVSSELADVQRFIQSTTSVNRPWISEQDYLFVIDTLFSPSGRTTNSESSIPPYSKIQQRPSDQSKYVDIKLYNDFFESNGLPSLKTCKRHATNGKISINYDPTGYWMTPADIEFLRTRKGQRGRSF